MTSRITWETRIFEIYGEMFAWIAEEQYILWFLLPMYMPWGWVWAQDGRDYGVFIKIRRRERWSKAHLVDPGPPPTYRIDEEALVVALGVHKEGERNMKKFEFDLGEGVKMAMTEEYGVVIGRAEYSEDEMPPQYYVRYKAADGRQSEGWYPSAALSKANG